MGAPFFFFFFASSSWSSAVVDGGGGGGVEDEEIKKRREKKAQTLLFLSLSRSTSKGALSMFCFALRCDACGPAAPRRKVPGAESGAVERASRRESERARERASRRVEGFVISAPPSIIRVFGLADGQTHAFSLSLFLPFSRLFSSLSSGSRARGGIEKLEGADFGRREGDEGARKGREKQSPPAPSFSLRRRHVRNADSSSSSLLPFPTTSASSSSLLLFPTSSPSSSPSPHTASTWPTRTTTKTTTWTPRR